MAKDLYELGEIPPIGEVPAQMHAQLVRPDRYGEPESAIQERGDRRTRARTARRPRDGHGRRGELQQRVGGPRRARRRHEDAGQVGRADGLPHRGLRRVGRGLRRGRPGRRTCRWATGSSCMRVSGISTIRGSWPARTPGSRAASACGATTRAGARSRSSARCRRTSACRRRTSSPGKRPPRRRSPAPPPTACSSDGPRTPWSPVTPCSYGGPAAGSARSRCSSSRTPVGAPSPS